MCAKCGLSADIPCCGMAGDRGMRFPELTAAACQHVNLQEDVSDGYSNSRTCEIAVSNATGMGLCFTIGICPQPVCVCVLAAWLISLVVFHRQQHA